MMNRILQFVRSLLPIDPKQLLFIAGLVCLTIAPRLGWLPLADLASPVLDAFRGGLTLSQESRMEWGRFLSIAIYAFIFASSAGYFICCWPGKRPPRSVWLLVVLPSLAAFCAIGVKYINLMTPHSIFQMGFGSGQRPAWILTQMWNIGTAMRFSFAGLVFVTIFVLLLSMKKTSLPISVAGKTGGVSEESEAWKGCKRLIWIFQGAPLLAALPLKLISLLLLLIWFGNQIGWQYRVFRGLTPAAEGFVFFGVAVWAMGKDNWKFIRPQIQLPTLRYAGLGLGLPAAAGLLPSLATYLFDRADWAAHSFGKLEPPQFGDYLRMPEVWMVALFLGAFAEEVIFRGVLQRQFIERFGLWRGIFFVGIIWAAFHFYGDSYFQLDDLGVVIGLSSRVIFCVTLGFVLSWLTLRSKSLIPATLAHGLNNVFAHSKSEVSFPGQHWVHLGLLAILAYALFRYWPADTTSNELPSPAAIASEPAV